MHLRKLMVAIAATAALGSAHALDVVIAEGFNNVAGLSAAGWTLKNNSVSPAPFSWSQGNTANFTASAGPADSYAASGFLTTFATSGAISNWLITPAVTLTSASELVFFVRSAGEGFLDKLEVRLSTTGTDVGTTATSLGGFTTLLTGYTTTTDDGWIGLNYTFSGLSAGETSARIGFRYVVDDVATDGNYLGLDSVYVTGVATAVPEPATYLLLAMGLTGVMLRRRLGA